MSVMVSVDMAVLGRVVAILQCAGTVGEVTTEMQADAQRLAAEVVRATVTPVAVHDAQADVELFDWAARHAALAIEGGEPDRALRYLRTALRRPSAR